MVSLEDTDVLEMPVDIEDNSLLSEGGGTLSVDSKKEDTDFLQRSKKDIFVTLNIPSKGKGKPSKKINISRDLYQNLDASKKAPLLLLKVQQLLSSVFKETISEQYIKDRYTKGYLRLPIFKEKLLDAGFYRVLVNSVNEHGVKISLGKYGKDVISGFVPKKNLLGNDYMRSDEIVIQLTLENNEPHFQEVDTRYYTLQKKGLLHKTLKYVPLGSNKVIQGTIVDIGEYPYDSEVVFKPEKGTQFSLKLDTLLKGIEKAKTPSQKPLDKQSKIQKPIITLPKKEVSILPPQKLSIKKTRYNGFEDQQPKKHGKFPRGRDGEKIVY